MSDLPAITHRTDLLELALSLMPRKWRGNMDRFEALLEIFVEVFQELEDVDVELVLDTMIETAEGVHLDQWGELVGEPRADWPDDDYRRLIRARILTNRSGGLPEDLISILLLLTDLDELTLIEWFPKEIGMLYKIDPPTSDEYREKLVRQMNEAASGGVRVRLVETRAGRPFFGFAGGNAKGFGVGHLSKALTLELV